MLTTANLSLLSLFTIPASDYPSHMLDRDQIRQLMLHEDHSVRYEAGKFFSDCANPPADIADTFWASFDRYGIGDSGVSTSYRSILQTPFACDRVLEKLAGRLNGDDLYTLSHALDDIPMDYLLENRSRVLSAAEPLPPRKPGLLQNYKLISTQAHLQERLELVETPPAEIWDRLAGFALTVDRMARSEWDPRSDDRLMEALSRHPDFTIARSLAVIDSGDTSWLRVFALDLLERLRHRPSIPLFLSLLDVDADCDREAARRAITAMANHEIIESLVHAYPTATPTHRTVICESLGHMGLPEAEQALLTFAQRDGLDYEDRAWIAWALFDTFTTDGFELLRTWAEEEACDTSVIDPREVLPTLAVALGRDLPEAKSWPKRQYNDRPGLPLSWLDPGRNREETEIPAEPVKPHSKVGRNDPCPCGSGKKYKKCCGR